MNTSNRKLILALITTLLGVFSSGAMAQTVTLVSGSTYAYFNGTTTTNYDFTTLLGTADNTAAITSNNNPWWGSQDTATLFAASVAGNLGLPNSLGSRGPVFQFTTSSGVSGMQYRTSPEPDTSGRTGNLSTFTTYVAATASSAGVPEIDGALAPKVGFLLACLFLIFGRKKENTEPMLTV